MKRSRWLTAVLSVLVLLTGAACEVPYSNPPATFQESDLVGAWEASYNLGLTGNDRLILRADGIFKQVYHDRTVKDYVYETPWNKWWVERFPDGRVRVHLQGARYYRAGIRVAELDGMGDPCPEKLPDCGWGHRPRSFYDSIAKESVEMVGKLILNVQSGSSRNPVLLHMLTSSDEGYIWIFTGRAEDAFRRVKTP